MNFSVGAYSDYFWSTTKMFQGFQQIHFFNRGFL